MMLNKEKRARFTEVLALSEEVVVT